MQVEFITNSPGIDRDPDGIPKRRDPEAKFQSRIPPGFFKKPGILVGIYPPNFPKIMTKHKFYNH